MNTSEMKKLKEWPKIKEAFIDFPIAEFKRLDPNCKAVCRDTGTSFIIEVDGVDEFELDADMLS